MDQLSYRRHRFPPPIIQHAIWLYLRFTLSYRDVEELLAERGLEVSYETVRRWVLKFGPAVSGAPMPDLLNPIPAKFRSKDGGRGWQQLPAQMAEDCPNVRI